MAYPATYNISYYRGDTYQFDILPKNSAGVVFPLTGYSAEFYLEPVDGSAAAFSAGSLGATISDGKVKCQITSTLGKTLEVKDYKYDVQIKNGVLVYTLLKGVISVTPDVAPNA